MSKQTNTKKILKIVFTIPFPSTYPIYFYLKFKLKSNRTYACNFILTNKLPKMDSNNLTCKLDYFVMKVIKEIKISLIIQCLPPFNFDIIPYCC